MRLLVMVSVISVPAFLQGAIENYGNLESDHRWNRAGTRRVFACLFIWAHRSDPIFIGNQRSGLS